MWNPVVNQSRKYYVKLTTTIVIALALVSVSHITHSESAATKVKTQLYEDIKVNVSHTLGGAVPATQDSNISAQISAIIKSFHVDTGYEVQKNELLVSLDCREKLLKLAQTKATLKAEKVKLEHAILQFQRAKKLNTQSSISKELYNQRAADENQLKATVDNKKATNSLAELNVEHCKIKAPFSGYITKRNASIGELTQPGSSLLQLVSKTNNIVEIKVNNRLLNSFTQGKNHHFIFNNDSYPLKIEHIIPILDSATRNHIARLNFIDNHAITGSIGKVSWQDTSSSIPSSYIVTRNKKLGIFIADNNIAKFIEIKNANEGQTAAIKLDDNVEIITNGRFNVNNGDLLQIETE